MQNVQNVAVALLQACVIYQGRKRPQHDNIQRTCAQHASQTGRRPLLVSQFERVRRVLRLLANLASLFWSCGITVEVRF